jgi:hypothetical protein
MTKGEFDSLAAERQLLESDTGSRHKMIEVGDELTGIVTKFGDRGWQVRRPPGADRLPAPGDQ